MGLLNRIVQIANRANIRSRYNIRGDSVDDCLTSWCCRSCSLAQESREIALEENSFEEFSESK
jgi:Cys-rich protein (TIGR01571 family)